MDRGTYGTIAEVDTGRRVTVLNTEWPIKHTLSRYGYGWVVARDVCGGDHGLQTLTTFKSERLARYAFARLLQAEPLAEVV